jgi:pimeloyl-ACP methyl ester carboxylesterase
MKKLFIILFIIHATVSAQEVEVRDIELRNYDYPFPVEYFELEVQGQKMKMAYMHIKADAPNGQTITLLHGKNFNGAYWETTINALISSGYNVFVPDQIGFGKSSKPEYLQYTFQQLAENTKKILDTLQINNTTVLGHSMGGMLATRFALMYPETTSRLILLNPIGLEDWKTIVPYRSVEDWYKRELSQTYEGIRNYQQENFYDGKWNEDYDEWAKLLAGWTLNENYPLIAWNSALTYDMIFTQPVVYEFPDLKMPVLLIIGTRDRTALGKDIVSPEVKKTLGRYDQLGEKIDQKIPDSKLIELENVGHLPHIEAFEKFIVPLLEYLQK